MTRAAVHVVEERVSDRRRVVRRASMVGRLAFGSLSLVGWFQWTLTIASK